MFGGEEEENNSYLQQSKGRKEDSWNILKRDWIVWMCLIVMEDVVMCACVCIAARRMCLRFTFVSMCCFDQCNNWLCHFSTH